MKLLDFFKEICIDNQCELTDVFILESGDCENGWELENAFRNYFGSELCLSIGLENLRENTAYLCIPAVWWKNNGILLQKVLPVTEPNIYAICETVTYLVVPIE